MSLTERLREAALERARRSGGVVDGRVIEPEGVLDLRDLERQQQAVVDNQRITLPLLRHRPEPNAPSPLVPRPAPQRDPAPPPPTATGATAQPTADRPMAEARDPLFDATELPTSRCPRCQHTVERHMLDLFAATEYYSCEGCGHMWQHRRTG